MSKVLVSDRQRQLFEALARCGELVFACGHDGINANIVGEFYIHPIEDEDRLVVGDGTQHVHIRWENVQRVEVGEFHGEGMITFYMDGILLFKLYRIAGPYPNEVRELSGALIDRI